MLTQDFRKLLFHSSVNLASYEMVVVRGGKY